MRLLYKSMLVLYVSGRADAHARMAKPATRDCPALRDHYEEWCDHFGGFEPAAVVGSADGSPTTGPDNYICRGIPSGQPTVTVTAGGKVEFQFSSPARHPGDCALYASYNGSSVADNDKLWALVWEQKDCLCYDEQTTITTPPGGVCSYRPLGDAIPCRENCLQYYRREATLPNWLPAGDNVAFHWEWYANHPRENGAITGYPTIEIYTDCFDATVIASSESKQVSDLRGWVNLARHQHLPNTAHGFKGNQEVNRPMSFPPMATYVGQPTPAPTPEPPTPAPTPPPIPTQRPTLPPLPPSQQTPQTPQTAETPPPTTTPTPSNLCSTGRILNQLRAAGQTCRQASGLGGSSIGESISGFTSEQCAAANGHWETYTCANAEQGVTANPQFAPFLKEAWAHCCDIPELVEAPAFEIAAAAGPPLQLAASLFGGDIAGDKVFTGSLSLTVNSSQAFLSSTDTNKLKQALRSGIASSISGVEASMVEIMSVGLPARRLGDSPRRLSAVVKVDYYIKVPQSSSVSASMIGDVGDQFTTALNTELQSAGIPTVVQSTQSPMPTESVGVTPPPATAATEPPSTGNSTMVDAGDMLSTSPVLGMALVIATVMKALV